MRGPDMDFGKEAQNETNKEGCSLSHFCLIAPLAFLVAQSVKHLPAMRET